MPTDPTPTVTVTREHREAAARFLGGDDGIGPRERSWIETGEMPRTMWTARAIDLASFLASRDAASSLATAPAADASDEEMVRAFGCAVADQWRLRIDEDDAASIEAARRAVDDSKAAIFARLATLRERAERESARAAAAERERDEAVERAGAYEREMVAPAHKAFNLAGIRVGALSMRAAIATDRLSAAEKRAAEAEARIAKLCGMYTTGFDCDGSCRSCGGAGQHDQGLPCSECEGTGRLPMLSRPASVEAAVGEERTVYVLTGSETQPRYYLTREERAAATKDEIVPSEDRQDDDEEGLDAYIDDLRREGRVDFEDGWLAWTDASAAYDQARLRSRPQPAATEPKEGGK